VSVTAGDRLLSGAAASDLQQLDYSAQVVIVRASMLDAFSRRIAGWSIDTTQTTLLVLNALGMATRRRVHRDGLVIRSDRGAQFTSRAFSRRVRDVAIAPSMGATGSCDNAMMEPSWARKQVELLNRRRWITRVARYRDPRLHRALPQHTSPHSALGMRTPAEVEAEWSNSGISVNSLRPRQQSVMFNRSRLVSLVTRFKMSTHSRKPININGPFQNPGSTETGSDQTLRGSRSSLDRESFLGRFRVGPGRVEGAHEERVAAERELLIGLRRPARPV
jgi:integrase-like protein